MIAKVTRRTLVGLPAAPGAAHGPAFVIEAPRLPEARHITEDQVDAEIERLQVAAEAVAAASHELARDVAAGGAVEESGIFAAHAEMARDPALLDDAAEHIRSDRLDAVGAITTAAESSAAMLRGLSDETLRARATDVMDVGTRIARQLAGLAADEVRPEKPSVIVAQDLAPSLTATLPRDLLLGIALEGSSPTAHASILARAYGIPAVVGTAGLVDAVREAAGVDVMLDGATGEVVLAPEPDDLAHFESVAAGLRVSRERDLAEADQPARTRDGTTVTLLANLGSPTEASAALELGAQGVGLFRTEFLFLERSAAPSEDEQVDAYGAVAEAFAPHPVTIRLLDVGGDKPIPYLPVPHEENPFLGVRALRLAHDRPEIFLTQLRACYRAAVRGNVKVMAPMVADLEDVELLLRLANEARESLRTDGVDIGEVDLGVMLEIPAAVLVADTYLPQLKFASLGTNDLAQYAMAADRGNPALGRYRDALHPALLHLVADAVAAARRATIELSVCGEMAGDPAGALALVGLGVRALSMSAASLPAVRRAIRASSVGDLADRASAALGDASAPEVRARFEE